jgi:putative peptide zinc metalloprotease protein
MTMPMNAYQVEEIEQTGTDRYYLLKVNGRPYKIGELVYLILDGLSRQLSYQEIGSLLNAHVSDNRYSAQDVATVVEQRLLPMGLFTRPWRWEPFLCAGRCSLSPSTSGCCG